MVPMAPSIYAMRSVNSLCIWSNTGLRCRGSWYCLYSGTGGRSASGASGSKSGATGFRRGVKVTGGGPAFSLRTAVGWHLGSSVAAYSIMRSVAFSHLHSSGKGTHLFYIGACMCFLCALRMRVCLHMPGYLLAPQTPPGCRTHLFSSTSSMNSNNSLSIFSYTSSFTCANKWAQGTSIYAFCLVILQAKHLQC